MSKIDYYLYRLSADYSLINKTFNEVNKGINGTTYATDKHDFETAKSIFMDQQEIPEKTINQAAQVALSETKKTTICNELVEIIRKYGETNISNGYVSEKYGISTHQAVRIMTRVRWYLRNNPLPFYNDWETTVIVPPCHKFCKQQLFGPVDDGLTLGTYFETKQSILNFDNSMY